MCYRNMCYRNTYFDETNFLFIKRTQTQTYSGSKIPLLTQKKLKLYSASNIKCVEYVQNIPKLKKYLYTINTSFPTQKREKRTPTPP